MNLLSQTEAQGRLASTPACPCGRPVELTAQEGQDELLFPRGTYWVISCTGLRGLGGFFRGLQTKNDESSRHTSVAIGRAR